MRLTFHFLLFIALFGVSACALFKKKNKITAPIEIPLAPISKYLGDPVAAPVLLLLGNDNKFTQRMLDRGYNLIQVVEAGQQADFRAEFGEYSDARLRLTDFMQGKMGDDMAYSGIVMDESYLGRPIGIQQNQKLVQLLWLRLEKGSSLMYFEYTKEAAQYGKKESSFNQAEIFDLVRFKFNQYQVDSSSIPGIHILKFTK